MTGGAVMHLLSVRVGHGLAATPVLALPVGPPGEVVAIVAIVFGVFATIGFPLVRAFARRIEGGRARSAELPPDVTTRLERIERSVEAVALEVERISEGQRFVTKLLSERSDAVKLPPLGP